MIILWSRWQHGWTEHIYTDTICAVQTSLPPLTDGSVLCGCDSFLMSEHFCESDLDS